MTVGPPGAKPPAASPQLAARHLIKSPSVWAAPAILVSLLVFAMTLVYFGSVVNPAGHLHGLPVSVVDEDAGASANTTRWDLGANVAAGLTGSRAVSARLALRSGTSRAADHRMDLGKNFATVVIPLDFSASLLALAAGSTAHGRALSLPRITVLTNPRAGTLGVSLATGVLEPALEDASKQIGQELSRATGAAPKSALADAILRDPVQVGVTPYRPLPPNAGAGLSAFYIALLTTMCGFLGAIIVNMGVDSALGYAPTEVGPWWRLRQPVAITRLQTLLAKWAIVAVLTVVLTGVMLAAASGILGMNTPHFGDLWLLVWFSAAGVAFGTLVLFASLGAIGQLVAMLIFVYLALASSGGTVPLQALSGFFRFVAEFEPLRQILGGVRAILYFGASGPAGLTRAWIAGGLALVFWLALGAAVTFWYDRSSKYRMPPDLMSYVDRAVRDYQRSTQGTASITLLDAEQPVEGGPA